MTSEQTHHRKITHPWWLPHQHDTCHQNLEILCCICHTLKINNTCKHKSTHLVNAFLLVHHPSAHRTKTTALPFSTLQWSQTLETLSYTAALCRRAREGGGSSREGGVGAGEERVGTDGSGGGERNRGGKGEAELLSAATALLICYLFLHKRNK